MKNKVKTFEELVEEYERLARIVRTAQMPHLKRLEVLQQKYDISAHLMGYFPLTLSDLVLSGHSEALSIAIDGATNYRLYEEKHYLAPTFNKFYTTLQQKIERRIASEDITRHDAALFLQVVTTLPDVKLAPHQMFTLRAMTQDVFAKSVLYT